MSKTLVEYKIIPRFMMLAFTVMAWNVCDWFMGLGAAATTQQTAFVSTIVGAATGAFGIWMSNEGK